MCITITTLVDQNIFGMERQFFVYQCARDNNLYVTFVYNLQYGLILYIQRHF